MSAATYIGGTGLFSTISTGTSGPFTGVGVYTGPSTTASTGLPMEYYLTEFWYQVGEMSFWSKFMGAGKGAPIQTKQDLTAKKGGIVEFELIDADTNAPIQQTKEAWLSEETSTVYSDNVMLGLARHAKRIDVPQTEQISPHELRSELYDIQRQWWIEYGIDKWITRKFTGLSFFDAGGSATANVIGEAGTTATNIMYGGDATSTATIEASDVFSFDLMWKGKEAARMGYLATNMRKIHPIQTNTGAYYAAVLHPYQVADLKHATGSYWEQAHREAGARGPTNLIFAGTGNEAGALPQPIGYMDGVLVYEYSNLVTATTWGASSTINGAYGMLLGAQAGLLAYCRGPEWVEEMGHYKEYFGVMIRILMGFDKATFNSYDNGVISFQTAAKKHYDQ